MNDFMFHHITDGWIESNIPHYVNALMTQQTQMALGNYTHSWDNWQQQTHPENRRRLMMTYAG